MSEPVSLRAEERFASLVAGNAPKDAFLRSWLSQVLLRTRLELTWIWHGQAMPDRLARVLQNQSQAEQRQNFFAENETARYLRDALAQVKMPRRGRNNERGSLAWLARELDLVPAELFVVALALAYAREPDFGLLVAALDGEARKQPPTLALAQTLWPEPLAIQPMLSPSHPLFARGILRRGQEIGGWDSPIEMPPMVAQMLEGRLSNALLDVELLADGTTGVGEEVSAGQAVELELLAARMTQPIAAMHVVPVAAAGALEARRVRPALQAISARTGRQIYAFKPGAAVNAATLEHAGLFCWIRGADLLLPEQAGSSEAMWQAALHPYPVYVYAAQSGDAPGHSINRLPLLRIAPLGYTARFNQWKQELGRHRIEADDDAIRECAFRFRFDGADIRQTIAALQSGPTHLSLERMLAACQQQVTLQIGELAELIVPRFHRGDLVLAPDCAQQFDQLLNAMQNLSRVHAGWGTGSAWDDAGIAALFAGPPGTGKTMAAEVLAAELHLPLYRVDLSQVLNKYVGETEKSLRRLFDAAELADIVLFLDEAEVLLGQRMTAHQANDRFANMEVAYLLQRMERFRGLAVLATNRKKDLDEAFLRRLRFSIEFPAPGELERYTIWNQAIPNEVHREGLDLDFLAREFVLTGGNIRSIVLNACLLSATKNRTPALGMKAIIASVEREFEKLGRPVMREQRMHWQALIPNGEDWGFQPARGLS